MEDEIKRLRRAADERSVEMLESFERRYGADAALMVSRSIDMPDNLSAFFLIERSRAPDEATRQRCADRSGAAMDQACMLIAFASGYAAKTAGRKDTKLDDVRACLEGIQKSRFKSMATLWGRR